jgi:hypothetical protein
MKPELEELYAPFGPVVRAEVEDQVRRHGSLSSLLRRLNLNVPSRIDAQHEVLRNFLYQYGIAFFLRCIRANRPATEVERQKLLRLAHGSDYLRWSSSHPTPTDTGWRDRTGQTAEGRPAPVHAAPHGAEDIPDVTSSSRDRRRGDRRGGNPTRRSRVDAVSRNRRFGGRDRRKSDRRLG